MTVDSKALVKIATIHILLPLLALQFHGPDAAILFLALSCADTAVKAHKSD